MSIKDIKNKINQKEGEIKMNQTNVQGNVFLQAYMDNRGQISFNSTFPPLILAKLLSGMIIDCLYLEFGKKEENKIIVPELKANV